MRNHCSHESGERKFQSAIDLSNNWTLWGISIEHGAKHIQRSFPLDGWRHDQRIDWSAFRIEQYRIFSSTGSLKVFLERLIPLCKDYLILQAKLERSEY